MTKGKRTLILIIALLLVFAVAAPLAVALSPVNNQQNPLLFVLSLRAQSSPQPPSKQYTDVTWNNPTISNVNVSQNLNITLNGNLTITGTGELHLRHCILNVNNGTNPVEYGVNVTTGGELYINESSTITAINPSNSYFFVVNGSTFQMNDSLVEWCGHSSGSWPDQQGFLVSADNTWIENNTIINGYRGLFLYQLDGGTILDNEAITNTYTGFSVRECSNVNLTNNTATSNTYAGFWLEFSDDNNLTGNTAVDNSLYGGFYIYPDSDNNNLTGNYAVFNSIGFRVWSSTGNNFTDNILTYNDGYDFELVADANNNTFTRNSIFEGNIGFFVKNSQFNNFTNNIIMYVEGNSSINLMSSDYNNLTGNIVLNSNQYGFYLDDSDGNILFDNTVINSTSLSLAYNWTTNSINNYFNTSVVANLLFVNVTESGGLPLPGAEVLVVNNGEQIYATPYFGGTNSTTDSDGLTAVITVPYKIFFTNDSLTEVTTNITVWYSTMFEVATFSSNPRTVDMSTSHVENFTVVSWQSTPLKTMLPLLFLSGMQGGVSPVIYAVLGIAAVGAVLAVVLFYYFRRVKT